MTTSMATLAALYTLGSITEYFPAEAGQPAAEAIGLAEDLVKAGHADPAGMIRILRDMMAEDWRAVLAGRFVG